MQARLNSGNRFYIISVAKEIHLLLMKFGRKRQLLKMASSESCFFLSVGDPVGHLYFTDQLNNSYFWESFPCLVPRILLC